MICLVRLSFRSSEMSSHYGYKGLIGMQTAFFLEKVCILCVSGWVKLVSDICNLSVSQKFIWINVSINPFSPCHNMAGALSGNSGTFSRWVCSSTPGLFVWNLLKHGTFYACGVNYLWIFVYKCLCLRCQMTNLYIFLFELVPSLQQQQWLTHVRHNKSQQTPWQTWQRSQMAPRKKLCRLANGSLSKRMPACPNWITVSSMGLGVRVSKRLKGWQQAKLKH